ncbi:MAG: hypothetical protein ACI83D_000629 [Planctomycetota bacterium]|jgi:hypothetical protein
MITREMVAYIKHSLEQGQNEEQIEASLIKTGWENEEINQAILYARQEIAQASGVPSPQLQEHKYISSDKVEIEAKSETRSSFFQKLDNSWIGIGAFVATALLTIFAGDTLFATNLPSSPIRMLIYLGLLLFLAISTYYFSKMIKVPCVTWSKALSVSGISSLVLIFFSWIPLLGGIITILFWSWLYGRIFGTKKRKGFSVLVQQGLVILLVFLIISFTAVKQGKNIDEIIPRALQGEIEETNEKQIERMTENQRSRAETLITTQECVNPLHIQAILTKFPGDTSILANVDFDYMRTKYIPEAGISQLTIRVNDIEQFKSAMIAYFEDPQWSDWDVLVTDREIFFEIDVDHREQFLNSYVIHMNPETRGAFLRYSEEGEESKLKHMSDGDCWI